MQEIDEFVDRKGIGINWQIVPRAFAHSLTSNLFEFFGPPLPSLFFRHRVLASRNYTIIRNAKESSLFKRFASKNRLRVYVLNMDGSVRKEGPLWILDESLPTFTRVGNLKPGRRATRIIGSRNVALFSLSGVENRIWRGLLRTNLGALESGCRISTYLQRICCS